MAEGAWLGGVCTGLARHLGWPLMAVRIAFVALATFQFIGVIAYGALWLLLPPESTVKAPGLESASRAGMRDHGRPKRRIDWGMLLALIALGVGLAVDHAEHRPGYQLSAVLAGGLCLRWSRAGLASGRLRTAEALARRGRRQGLAGSVRRSGWLAGAGPGDRRVWAWSAQHSAS